MDFRRLCISSCWRFNFWQHRNHKQFSEFEDSTYLDSSTIEIDKAIKRGEKPSVIAKIKKYQEQQEAYEKRKEKTKDYHRNEER